MIGFSFSDSLLIINIINNIIIIFNLIHQAKLKATKNFFPINQDFKTKIQFAFILISLNKIIMH